MFGCFQELSKITMPVVFNEPLSFLQRMVEYLEYASLLTKASECDNVIERLEVSKRHISVENLDFGSCLDTSAYISVHIALYKLTHNADVHLIRQTSLHRLM